MSSQQIQPAAYANHLERINQAPRQQGTLELIVIRPETDARQELEVAQLETEQGLVGDNWVARGSRRTPDGSAHPEMQITLINTRVLEAVAGPRERWALAGDQLFVDLDLSEANLPVGTRLFIGDACLEITPMLHSGCQKFSARYGVDALRWVNTPEGRALRLRGVYARVLRSGQIRRGDDVRVERPAE